MKVRWNSIGGNLLLTETDLIKKIELGQIKKQIEILATFMPDEILNMTTSQLQQVQHFVGVLLFADVSGFTPLCEKYNKTGKGGIYRLTATLNGYIGAIVEVIYFYGGDVLKFSGDAFLALWRAEPDVCLFKVIHNVIVCALFIQQTLGRFETEVNVLLKVKLAISCGNMTFSVIGDDDKQYVILGPAINDVKAAEHASVSGDVVIAPTAWGHIPEESYEVTYGEGGNVKVWRCLYKPNERAKKDEYDEKHIVVQKLCDQHIKHRNNLHKRKRFDDNFTDSKITENFVRSLPVRTAVQKAPQHWIAKDLRPFIIKPVQDQVDERQPLEYLTEMREVTIQFINIVPESFHEPLLVDMLDSAFGIICDIVYKLLGVVNKVSLFDKDAMFLVIFGLRGIKHELESQNSLKSAYKIRKAISKLDGVKSVSVGVTNGLVYCGVVGHPLRREFTVIGGAVNKAARIMCAYQQKVTCDFNTYKNSKLSSSYFELQPELKLKGIENAGNIFEYNEDFEEPILLKKKEKPVIGRDNELDFVHMVVNHPQKVNDYYGVCFRGKQKIGKSKFIMAAADESREEGHAVASMVLCGSAQRPYFCVSTIYKQLYDMKTKLNSIDSKMVKELPPDLWNLNEILQSKSPHLRHAAAMNRKNKILEMFISIAKASRRGTAVIFIDDLQFIDIQSFDILEATIKEKCVRLICTGQFEEDTWDIQWKLSISEQVKVVELEPLRPIDIPSLACQFLTVRGLPTKLVNLLIKSCEGRPGWVQCCLLRLVNNGDVEIKYVLLSTVDKKLYVLPDADLLDEKPSSGDDQKVVAVAELSSTFKDHNEELTLAAISLDLFDSFTPYQQLVIKTGAVMGEIFSRALMMVMLKYPNEQTFADAIINLYEEDVFDCGSRYINSTGLQRHKLHCICYMEPGDYDIAGKDKSSDMPRYAFCKLLHFKNKSLRAVAYELLPANQRKELHARITDVLENQRNSCPYCLRDDSAAIIQMRRFKEIMAFCNDPDLNYVNGARSDADFVCEGEVIKEIIRSNIKKCEDVPFRRRNVAHRPLKHKIWDPTFCFCLEILSRVYADLIYHSEQASHLGKRIFFLMQYGIILMIMNEYKEAVAPLTEASELCMTDAKQEDSLINDTFRKMHVGKIHRLLADTHFKLGNKGIGKVHILISLRQYNVPMLSMKYKIPNCWLNRECITKHKTGLFDGKNNSLMNHDFGVCMSIVSNMFALDGHWEFAKKAAARSISLLRASNANVSVLCDAYSNAISYYNYFGDTHTCRRLERCVSREVLRNYTGNATMELYAISKLIAIIFETRFMSGNIHRAIRIGYRALYLNTTIQAYYVQTEMLPIMATALIAVQRIQDAVEIAKLLYNLGKTVNPPALVNFYAFAVELIVDTGFTMEPIDSCELFAEQHFETVTKKNFLEDSENKLLVYLHVFYLRNCRWSEALKWKNVLRLEKSECHHILSVANMFKYTESLLLMLVRNITMKKNFIDLEHKRIQNHLKQCQEAAKKWIVFMPRFLHLKAYYCKIKNRRGAMKKHLKNALKLADKQENVLEHAWILQSKHSWQGSFSAGADINALDWRLAKTYTPLEWSQILYALPSNN